MVPCALCALLPQKTSDNELTQIFDGRAVDHLLSNYDYCVLKLA